MPEGLSRSRAERLTSRPARDTVFSRYWTGPHKGRRGGAGNPVQYVATGIPVDSCRYRGGRGELVPTGGVASPERAAGPVIHQAAILCGGLGTRLGSLTSRSPKPLLPVGGHPFLD